MSIKIENTEVFGWKMAIAGCRNPMNSRDKSDSAFFDRLDFNRDYYFHDINGKRRDWQDWLPPSEEEPSKCDAIKWLAWYKKMKMLDEDPFPIGYPLIGPNDHKLLMNLCKGGTEEAKWRRMIHVQMDITAPLYWWKEFETYKVATVSNSCSTMHKIHAREFTMDDFSCEHLIREPNDIPNFTGPNRFDDEINWHYNNGAYNAYKNSNEYEDWVEGKYSLDNILCATIYALNYYRKKFLETNDKKYWWQMIQLLPSSYNQRRTIDLNYEVLSAQYRQRKEHKLDCWHQYCDWIKTLPYSEFITMEETE